MVTASKNQILKDHIGLIKSIASTFSGDQEELVQLGLIAVSNNLHKFDKNRGKISTFIGTVVKNRLINYIQREQHLVKTPRTKQKFIQAEMPHLMSNDFILDEIEVGLSQLTVTERGILSEYLINPQDPTSKQSKVLRKLKCSLTSLKSGI